MLRVAPGGTSEIPFVLAWHLPNLVNYWGSLRDAARPERARGADAQLVHRPVAGCLGGGARDLRRLPELTAETRAFRDALFGSTLPEPVLDAVSSQMSIIRTTTCLRTEDGRSTASRAATTTPGCCPMNCTHVWNYEQALAFLFPQARAQRAHDGLRVQHPTRRRAEVPHHGAPADGVVWNYVAAADGQMGTLLKLYREWLIAGDDEALRRLWPQAKKTLAFAWRHWDPDRDGVMEGEQHNTYDIEFYRPEHHVAARSTWGRCAPPRRWPATSATRTPTSTRASTPRDGRAWTASSGPASTTARSSGIPPPPSR